MENLPLEPSEQHSSSALYNPRTIIIFLGAVLLFGTIIFYSLSQFKSSPDSNNEQEEQNEEVVKQISSDTLVYGTWTGEQSVILGYDLETGKEAVLATLPSNVKKVSVLSPDTLLFINDTDVRDHGQEIALYTVSSKTTTPLISATPGFGIDDYVLSPDKQSIATWEVQLEPTSGVLRGGKSRVYTAKTTQNSPKNLIYDEIATGPVHYPRAILNDGTVFMDRFLPNDGAGWAQGMSVSNFTGTQKEELANMANGTYGGQPQASPDGKYLAFTGFLGEQGNQTRRGGYRRAMLTPNTVELLDTTTRERIKVPNLSTDNIYSDVSWDRKGEVLSFSAVSKNIKENGNYIYTLSTQTVTQKIENADSVTTPLNQEKILVGKIFESGSVIGNLGKTYEIPLTQLAVKDTKSGKTIPLPLSSSLTQVIDVIPSNYFTTFSTLQTPNEHNLQMKQLVIKTTMAPLRQKQQSNTRIVNRDSETSELPEEEPGANPAPSKAPAQEGPLCRNVATEQCNEMLGTNYANPDHTLDYQSADRTGNEAFTQCYKTQNKANSGNCSDSPLYLYGPEGTKLSVMVHTPLFGQSAPYTNGFHATLQGDGTFVIDGKRHSSIEFDYTPALRRIVPPRKGDVVATKDLEKTLRNYAQKLGLNKKETFDLVTYGASHVTGPFVFVSFFDHDTSHAILPMTFSTQPDTYRNIVFYFKNLSQRPTFSIEKPQIEKIKRGKLTVIEISGIVE